MQRGDVDADRVRDLASAQTLEAPLGNLAVGGKNQLFPPPLAYSARLFWLRTCRHGLIKRLIDRTTLLHSWGSPDRRSGMGPTFRISLVLHAEELDHVRRVLRARHPDAHPARVGKHVMWHRTPRRDDFVMDSSRQRQVGQPVAVDLSHLLLSESGLDAPQAVRPRF